MNCEKPPAGILEILDEGWNGFCSEHHRHLEGVSVGKKIEVPKSGFPTLGENLTSISQVEKILVDAGFHGIPYRGEKEFLASGQAFQNCLLFFRAFPDCYSLDNWHEEIKKSAVNVWRLSRCDQRGNIAAETENQCKPDGKSGIRASLETRKNSRCHGIFEVQAKVFPKTRFIELLPAGFAELRKDRVDSGVHIFQSAGGQDNRVLHSALAPGVDHERGY